MEVPKERKERLNKATQATGTLTESQIALQEMLKESEAMLAAVHQCHNKALKIRVRLAEMEIHMAGTVGTLNHKFRLALEKEKERMDLSD